MQPNLIHGHDKSDCTAPLLEAKTSPYCNCHLYQREGVVSVSNTCSTTGSDSTDVRDPTSTAESGVDREDCSESPDNAHSAVEVSQHSEIITLRGISYHIEFQDTITRCRKQLTENQSVSVRLRLEPDNGEDKNVVVVDVFVQGHWKPISYIPGNKVPKVYIAIHKDDITDVKFANISRTYFTSVGKFLYIPSITITEYRPWIKNDKYYIFNQHIDLN